MRRALAWLAAGLVLAAARRSATAAERSLLVIRRLARGGHAAVRPEELPGWRVRQSTKVSRHAAEGADVMRRYGARCRASST